MKVRFAWGMVLFAVLAAALWMTPPLGQAAALFCIVCAIGAIVNWVAEIKRPRDPYDLALLQQIHEREENKIDEKELNSYEPTGNVICLCCGNEFDSRMGVCPRCKKSQFS